jgi:hypothetical protein
MRSCVICTSQRSGHRAAPASGKSLAARWILSPKSASGCQGLIASKAWSSPATPTHLGQGPRLRRLITRRMLLYDIRPPALAQSGSLRCFLLGSRAFRSGLSPRGRVSTSHLEVQWRVWTIRASGVSGVAREQATPVPERRCRGFRANAVRARQRPSHTLDRPRCRRASQRRRVSQRWRRFVRACRRAVGADEHDHAVRKGQRTFAGSSSAPKDPSVHRDPKDAAGGYGQGRALEHPGLAGSQGVLMPPRYELRSVIASYRSKGRALPCALHALF